jgi:hypothetical protein
VENTESKNFFTLTAVMILEFLIFCSEVLCWQLREGNVGHMLCYELAWKGDPEDQVLRVNTYKNLSKEMAKGRDDL